MESYTTFPECVFAELMLSTFAVLNKKVMDAICLHC